MKKIILLLCAALIGIGGTGAALMHWLVWNDPGAAIATFGAACLAAAMLSPE